MNKYRNVPCEVNGQRYRSKKEAARHQELLLLEKAGKIGSLRREVPYELAPAVKWPSGRRASPALRYVADFVYVTNAPTGWPFVIEDCKGMRTAAYVLKRHLMYTVHGIEVVET